MALIANVLAEKAAHMNNNNFVLIAIQISGSTLLSTFVVNVHGHGFFHTPFGLTDAYEAIAVMHKAGWKIVSVHESDGWFSSYTTITYQRPEVL